MNKSIFRVIGIAAIAAVMCAGCQLAVDLGKKDKEEKEKDNDDTPSYTLTATASVGGKVFREPDRTTYAPNDLVKVTARADFGYAFTGWTGASTSKDTAINITMNGDKILTASFERQSAITYTLITTRTDGGSVKVGGAVSTKNPDTTTHAYGTSVRVTATPESNYTFAGWSGVSESKDTAITITMNGNKTLNASFERKSVTPPTEVNDFVGDWLFVEDIDSDYYYKTIFSFKSNGQFAIRDFVHIGNFWIEEVPIESDDRCQITWGTFGDKIYYGEKCDGNEFYGDTSTYSVSGDTLKINDDDGWHLFVRVNIETFKSSLGSSLKSQDPALDNTEWRQTESEIYFRGSSFGEYNNVYLSDFYLAVWYTEDSRLTLVGTECGRYETRDDGAWEECVSYSVVQEVTLEYELSNNNRTLRLRPVGSSEWDVWTPRDDGMSKSRAQSTQKKGIRAVSSFKDLLRFRPH